MKQIYLTLLVFLLIQPVFSQTVNFTSSNLPVIVINTNGQTIPDEPKITADMGIINNGPGKRNNITDSFTQYKGKIGIEIRGQSSQMFPMKSYSIELRDNAGKSVDKSLFGMPKESDWVLYAPYTDKTLMRNVLAYGLSRELGHWAARCIMVELILNGDYVGVYVFMEKIKRNGGRINIVKMAKTDTTGDAVTGGYIFSLDKEPNGWYSSYRPPNSSNMNTRQFSYVIPKPEDMVPAQKDYIKSYVDSFENVLYGSQFQDTINGVRKFTDLSSFMDYFIVNEVCPGDGAGLIPFWWNKLMTDTAFEAGLRCRWKSLRQTTLSPDRVNAIIDSIAGVVSEVQQRHFTKWPVLGKYIWPNPDPIPTSYEGELSSLKAWLNDRLHWIDNNLPDIGACADYTNVVGTMKVSSYPNPVGNSGKVYITSTADKTVNLLVVGMEGRVLSRVSQSVKRGENSIDLHTERWAKGVYIIEVSYQNKEVFRQKQIKL